MSAQGEVRKIKDRSLEYIFKSSVPLRCLNDKILPEGIASGCLIDYYDRRILLTVSHATKNQKNWAVFTEYNKLKGAIHYQLGGMYFLCKGSISSTEILDIDFSYVEVPSDLTPLRQEIDWKGNILNHAPVTIFNTDFTTQPNVTEKYGFSGYVMPEIENHHGQDYFLSEFKVYENLSYIRKENEYYVFKLPSPHQGHEHFKGCSGAPIIDSKGNLVALVCYGNQQTNEIYGIAIKNYKVAIDVLVGNI